MQSMLQALFWHATQRCHVDLQNEQIYLQYEQTSESHSALPTRVSPFEVWVCMLRPIRMSILPQHSYLSRAWPVQVRQITLNLDTATSFKTLEAGQDFFCGCSSKQYVAPPWHVISAGQFYALLLSGVNLTVMLPFTFSWFCLSARCRVRDFYYFWPLASPDITKHGRDQVGLNIFWNSGRPG